MVTKFPGIYAPLLFLRKCNSDVSLYSQYLGLSSISKNLLAVFVSWLRSSRLCRDVLYLFLSASNFIRASNRISVHVFMAFMFSLAKLSQHIPQADALQNSINRTKFSQPLMTFSQTCTVFLLVKLTHSFTTSSPDCRYPKCFPIKTICVFLVSYIRGTCLTHHNMLTLWVSHSDN
jgi:hypothetical protein